MKHLRLILIALALGAGATPAHGAVIGLAGGDIDPQSIFDPTEQAVDAGCFLVFSLPLGYDPFCAQYTIIDDNGGGVGEIFGLSEHEDFEFVLESIDFRLRRPAGGFYRTAGIGDCIRGLCVDEEFSDLDTLIASPLFDDGVTFRLAAAVLTDFAVLSRHGIFCLPFVPDCDVEFFSDRPSPGLSIVGVNGVANPGVAAVPEPAMLLLLGPGAALAIRRRRARAKNRRAGSA